MKRLLTCIGKGTILKFGVYSLGTSGIHVISDSCLGLQSMDRQLRVWHPSDNSPQRVVVQLKSSRSLQTVTSIVTFGFSDPTPPLPKALSDDGDALQEHRQALGHGASRNFYLQSRTLNPFLRNHACTIHETSMRCIWSLILAKLRPKSK